MKILQLSIPTSLGEIINIKYHLDFIKNNYDQISISFNTSLWKDCLHTEASDWNHKEKLWIKLLNDIGNLFFSEKPYILDMGKNYPFSDMGVLAHKLKLEPKKAEMANFLCAGNSLNLDEKYIVITTKVRQLPKNIFYPKSVQLWGTLKKLSQKYKIVILGEKLVEMRKEYNSISDSVFGLYEQIISNIPNNRILDLTVPALGETVSDLVAIRQDCLIMKEAEFVITLGVGGNFCMATSVANMTIGFRADNLEFTDAIYNKDYHNAIITKNWNYFIQSLEKYS